MQLMISSIGFPIRYSEEGRGPGSGTVGLCVKLEEDQEHIHGLTCCHAVQGSHRGVDSYGHPAVSDQTISPFPETKLNGWDEQRQYEESSKPDLKPVGRERE